MFWEITVLNETTGLQFTVDNLDGPENRIRFDSIIRGGLRDGNKISFSIFGKKRVDETAAEARTDNWFMKRMFPPECADRGKCGFVQCQCQYLSAWRPSEDLGCYEIRQVERSIVMQSMVNDATLRTFLLSAQIVMYDYRSPEFRGHRYEFPITMIEKEVMDFLIANNLQKVALRVLRPIDECFEQIKIQIGVLDDEKIIVNTFDGSRSFSDYMAFIPIQSKNYGFPVNNQKERG